MATEWQWHYLKRNYNPHTDKATIRQKLPVRDQISCIEFECEAEVTGEHYDHSIIDIIEKIEVIGDGSAVLYSMSPETAAFAHFTQIRSTPDCVRRDVVGTQDKYKVKICFGRYQRDEKYLLDTSAYSNVYLEIPWELDTTWFKTETFKYTIRYLRPIPTLAPAGFIRSRDIEYGKQTFLAGGHHYVDLPLKYPWYMLGCRIYDLDRDFEDNIGHIKLDIDDGRFILVDDDLDDLLTINNERLPYPVHVPHKLIFASAAAADYFRTYMGRAEEVTITPHFETSGLVGNLCAAHSGLSAWTGQRACYKLVSGGSATLRSGLANASVWGSAYMCCLIIKDWWQDWFEPVPHEPFPVADHSEADLDFTTKAGTVDDLRIFLQEICPPKI